MAIDATLAFFYRESTRFQRAPFKGYDGELGIASQLDFWTDDDLQKLNKILRWRAFSLDRSGRRFGQKAWKRRRQFPGAIPSPEVVLFNQFCRLNKTRVLDVGCFEGIHSVSLSLMGAKVIAVDGRVENIVKTIVRSGIYGATIETKKYVFEQDPIEQIPSDIDYVFHRSVLPLMEDPIKHLHDLGKLANLGIYLETVVCSTPTETYHSLGKVFSCIKMPNRRIDGEFSGLGRFSRSIDERTILDSLRFSGFTRVLHQAVWTNQFGQWLRIIALKDN